MADLTPRQSWMATLAKVTPLQLEHVVSTLTHLPYYNFLRPPEIGLTMVQGRTGGTGQPFYLGEMTITRCVVKLETPDLEEAIVGFGYVAGRSHRHAELAALCDALLQHSDWHDVIQTQVILPLQAIAQQQQEQQQRQAESTRVNFFTLVRGS
ncbi:phosphonate C-P lyase system protein PhnG [Leptolyngbya sp. FACHB-541]|uniref:phosphonate C-P lyase system protein PhnG n=1 Tax=Leptolyngbya sp. FACHB-541 TaxID=2692810 RepID=UPI00168735C6|nr:phosphonate C-P lyase system protein PhnG [Leptolyngbya sp. FACHB-541]MBD1996649.1 phosphonate C-P lyase system protein PhnG [Leptolyngbya sp. FACHB-541]